jgi:hypothetical protein
MFEKLLQLALVAVWECKYRDFFSFFTYPTNHRIVTSVAVVGKLLLKSSAVALLSVLVK